MLGFALIVIATFAVSWGELQMDYPRWSDSMGRWRSATLVAAPITAAVHALAVSALCAPQSMTAQGLGAIPRPAILIRLCLRWWLAVCVAFAQLAVAVGIGGLAGYLLRSLPGVLAAGAALLITFLLTAYPQVLAPVSLLSAVTAETPPRPVLSGAVAGVGALLVFAAGFWAALGLSATIPEALTAPAVAAGVGGLVVAAAASLTLAPVAQRPADGHCGTSGAVTVCLTSGDEPALDGFLDQTQDVADRAGTATPPLVIIQDRLANYGAPHVQETLTGYQAEIPIGVAVRRHDDDISGPVAGVLSGYMACATPGTTEENMGISQLINEHLNPGGSTIVEARDTRRFAGPDAGAAPQEGPSLQPAGPVLTRCPGPAGARHAR